MKILLGAIALTLAAPVAAQTAPATDPHAGHAQHQPSGAPAEHKMDCDCCDKAKEGGKDCCDKHAKEHAAEQGSHSAH